MERLYYNKIMTSLNTDICSIISNYIIKPEYELLDWISIDMLLEDTNRHLLSSNPNAIQLLKQFPDKIDWYLLAKNPNAIELLEQNPDKIKLDKLSSNPNAIHLLINEKNELLEGIDWHLLCRNPNAIKLLKANYNKIIRLWIG